MEQTVQFGALFPDYSAPEPHAEVLGAAQLGHAELDRESRELRLWISPAEYLPQKYLNEVQAALAARYSLRSVRLSPRYDPALLGSVDPRDLAQVFIRAYSPAAASLAGAKWTISAEKIEIQLAANGKDELLTHAEKVSAWVQEHFGVHPGVSIEANHALDGVSVFEETERIRREAMKNAPAAAVPEEKKKTAAAQQELGDLFYGRPFSGERVKISELNLDMFKAVVEGKVFAINHKELKKRNAWVVCFDVTDYTGSVRINQFMENEKAKPILDNVQEGMWVRIQGKMTFDRYDNEMVMQPNSIQKVKAPKRQDTAPEKRVELHLHTTMSSMDALTDTGAAVKQAAAWGHRAIAITDHGCAQSFPDAM